MAFLTIEVSGEKRGVKRGTATTKSLHILRIVMRYVNALGRWRSRWCSLSVPSAKWLSGPAPAVAAVSAYEATNGWTRSEGRTMTGSPREIYFADWDEAGPTDEICEVT